MADLFLSLKVGDKFASRHGQKGTQEPYRVLSINLQGSRGFQRVPEGTAALCGMSSVLALRLGILYRQEDLPFTHFGVTPDIVEQTCVFVWASK